MPKIKTIKTKIGYTETYIPISNDIKKFISDLSDDYLPLEKFYPGFKKVKELISAEHCIDIPEYDYWSVKEEDGINYIVFGKSDESIPPIKLKTGHIYFDNEMEGHEDAGNCATCNGAKCDSCTEVYRDQDGIIHEWPEEDM